jgi:hypothetical protein
MEKSGTVCIGLDVHKGSTDIATADASCDGPAPDHHRRRR